MRGGLSNLNNYNLSILIYRYVPPTIDPLSIYRDATSCYSVTDYYLTLLLSEMLKYPIMYLDGVPQANTHVVWIFQQLAVLI